MNRYDVLGGLSKRQGKVVAVTAATTALAGVGTAVYLATKAKWAAAALTFFVGAPIVTVTAVAVAAVLTEPDDGWSSAAPAKIPNKSG